MFKELTPEQQKVRDEQVAREEAARKKYGIKHWRHRENSRKAFAEHKLIFPSTTDSVNKLQHTLTFGSIRSGVLQKLVFIHFMVGEYRSPLHKELTKMYNECESDNKEPEE